MRNVRFFAISSLVIVVAIAMLACGSAKQTVVRPMRQQLSPEQRRLFDETYYEAINQHLAGNIDSAKTLFYKCLALDTTIAEVYDYLANYCEMCDSVDKAMAYIRKTYTLDPTNKSYIDNYGRVLIREMKLKEAAEVYERLAAMPNPSDETLDILSRIYINLEDYDNFLRVVNRMEAINGSKETTTFMKMQAYSMMGQKDQELATLRKFVDTHPYEPNYRVLLGNWLMNDGKANEAYEEYTFILRNEPTNIAARIALIDYYNETNNKQQADSIARDIIFDKKIPMSTRDEVLTQYIRNNEITSRNHEEIYQLLDSLIAKEPSEFNFWLTKAQYLEMRKAPIDTMININRQLLALQPDFATARIRLAMQLWEKGDENELTKVCQAGINYNPDEMAFYYFLGLNYYTHNDDDRALETFQKGIDQVDSNDNPKLVSDFYALIGDILHSKERYAEAFAAYDSSLHWNKENYSCMNNYAYFLAIKGENLEKAESMSQKTIKAEPTNATYLDTYAWVLFKLERYEEARAYIDRAIAESKEISATEYDHAGDIYYHCNLKDEAIDYWQKAYNKDKTSKTIEEKLKKNR